MLRIKHLEGDRVDNKLKEQVAGTHYRDGWKVQPVEFLWANRDKLDPLSANIIKYACRWPFKGKTVDDQVNDLDKIIQYAEFLKQFLREENDSTSMEG